MNDLASCGLSRQIQGTRSPKVFSEDYHCWPVLQEAQSHLEPHHQQRETGGKVARTRESRCGLVDGRHPSWSSESRKYRLEGPDSFTRIRKSRESLTLPSFGCSGTTKRLGAEKKVILNDASVNQTTEAIDIIWTTEDAKKYVREEEKAFEKPSSSSMSC